MLSQEHKDTLRKKMSMASEHYSPMAGPDLVLDMLDEIAAKDAEIADRTRERDHAHDMLDAAKREIAKLREFKEEIEEQHRLAIEGKCGHSDEKHCACYPILQRANAELRASLDTAKAYLVAECEKVKVLKQVVADAEARADKAEAEIAKLREDRDKWRDLAQDRLEGWEETTKALKAVLAERDALKKRVEELERKLSNEAEEFLAEPPDVDDFYEDGGEG